MARIIKHQLVIYVLLVEYTPRSISIYTGVKSMYRFTLRVYIYYLPLMSAVENYLNSFQAPYKLTASLLHCFSKYILA